MFVVVQEIPQSYVYMYFVWTRVLLCTLVWTSVPRVWTGVPSVPSHNGGWSNLLRVLICFLILRLYQRSFYKAKALEKSSFIKQPEIRGFITGEGGGSHRVQSRFTRVWTRSAKYRRLRYILYIVTKLKENNLF